MAQSPHMWFIWTYISKTSWGASATHSQSTHSSQCTLPGAHRKLRARHGPPGVRKTMMFPSCRIRAPSATHRVWSPGPFAPCGSIGGEGFGACHREPGLGVLRVRGFLPPDQDPHPKQNQGFEGTNPCYRGRGSGLGSLGHSHVSCGEWILATIVLPFSYIIGYKRFIIFLISIHTHIRKL